MPVEITHFEITGVADPNVVESKILGSPILIGNLYPIANQNTLSFERTPAFAGVPVSTFFKFRVHDVPNSLESNSGAGFIKWDGLLSTPDSANLQQTIVNDEVVNLLTVLPINDATEFIEIMDLSGVQNLKINNIQAYVGQRIDLIALYYSEFTAESEGGGIPYFELTYQPGANNIRVGTSYTLTFDLVSLASLVISEGPTVSNYTEDIEDPIGVFTNYPVIEESTYLEINGGYAFGIANITIVINSAFLALNAYNYVNVDTNGNQTEEYVNTTINAAIELDKQGKGTIRINNYIVVTSGVAKLGDVTITLLDINGNPALVNGVQVEQLLTNL